MLARLLCLFYDLVWYRTRLWYCVVFNVEVWYGAVRYGISQQGTQVGKVDYGGMLWHMVWYDMLWSGMVRLCQPAGYGQIMSGPCLHYPPPRPYLSPMSRQSTTLILLRPSPPPEHKSTTRPHKSTNRSQLCYDQVYHRLKRHCMFFFSKNH